MEIYLILQPWAETWVWRGVNLSAKITKIIPQKMNLMTTSNLAPIIVLSVLLYGCKRIVRDKRGATYRVTFKNKFWRKKLLWALSKYDSCKSVYIDGDVSFDFDLEDFFFKYDS